MKKDDSIYIDHLNASLDRITNYVSNYELDSFLKSEKTQDAVIRQLEIIGEATKKISPELKAKYEAIPWSDMAGMRDKLIHDYIGVDLWIIWETAINDIPKLKEQLGRVKPI